MVRRALRSTAHPILRGGRLLRGATDGVAVRRALAQIPAFHDARIDRVRTARNRTHLVSLEAADGVEQLVKLSDQPAGHRRLERERDALADLGGRIEDAELRKLVPRVLAHGVHGGWTYLSQSQLPGVPATPLLDGEPEPDGLLAAAAEVGARLHASGRHRITVGEPELAAWIDRPLSVVGRLLGASEPRTEALGRRLRDAIGGAQLDVGLVHGDYWSENILVDPGTRAVTGIVDWDSADPAGLALHDRLHLRLYARKVRLGTELGAEICRHVQDGAVRGPDAGIPADDVAGIDRRIGLALYWLRIVEANVERQPVQSGRRGWIRDNVAAVLACL